MRWSPDASRPPRRVLLIQLRRVGDAVLLTPSLDALRAAWPAARLHLLTAAPIPDLFAGDHRLAVVWVRPPRLRLAGLARALARESFDLVLDFQSLPVTGFLSRATGGFTAGFRRRARGWLYHRAVRLGDHRGAGYAADHKLDLLRAVGLAPRLVPARLVPPPPVTDAWADPSGRPRVVLAPVSRRVEKEWGADAFALTARRLHDITGAVFTVLGGPGERAGVDAVAARLNGVPHAPYTAHTLAQVGGLLRTADLFVGNDGGPRHIAAALGIPTVAYFGHRDPSPWTAPGPGPHRVLVEGRAGSDWRGDLELVPATPEAAAAAAASLLAASRA